MKTCKGKEDNVAQLWFEDFQFYQRKIIAYFLLSPFFDWVDFPGQSPFITIWNYFYISKFENPCSSSSSIDLA